MSGPWREAWLRLRPGMLLGLVVSLPGLVRSTVALLVEIFR
jgi:hypothetical protein